MKWLAILLMVANVALYLWMSGHQNETNGGRGMARPEVNRAGMVLLSELKKPAPAAVPPSHGSPEAPAPKGKEQGGVSPPPAGEPPAVTAPSASGEAAAAAADEPPAPARAQPAPPLCFRVGPFGRKQQLEDVAVGLRQEGIDFRVVQSRPRQLKATRVYLGPYPSRAEASAMVRRLKGMGVDAYPFRNGSRFRVSLGYFTQEELAGKYTAALAGKGIKARTEPEFKTLRPFDWLEVRIPGDRAARINGRDWGGPGIEVKPVACSA